MIGFFCKSFMYFNLYFVFQIKVLLFFICFTISNDHGLNYHKQDVTNGLPSFLLLV